MDSTKQEPSGPMKAATPWHSICVMNWVARNRSPSVSCQRGTSWMSFRIVESLFTSCRAIESAPDTASPWRSFRVPCTRQHRPCTYKLHTGGGGGLRSRNHCCRGKAISITYSECVCTLSYPPRKAHAPYYIVICGLAVPYFSTLSHTRHDFWKKLLNTKCVFLFHLQLLSETFPILRRIQKDMNVHTSSCKVPVILVRF
jgi:hypothetical protein